MTYTLIPQLWYTITPATDCDVSTPNGISIHLPAGIQYFHFADGTSIDITGEAAVTQNPPLFRPASASALGGGYIESNLYVGHGAADAVAAVCTLTPGDLSQGGTLTDGTASLTLVKPQAFATGWVGVADATAAGTIKFGGHGAIVFDAAAGTKALGYFICVPDNYEVGGTLKLVRGEEVLFEHEFQPPQGAGWTLEGIKADLESDPAWECEIVDETSEIDFLAPVAGTGWNDVELVLEGELFSNGEVYHGGMFGGTDGRTPQAVVDALNASGDCPVVAQLDADELGISFTAKEYGVNDTITITGGLFEDAGGMEGGHGDYSVQEIVSAINAKTDFAVTAAAAETASAITLTANTPGAAANAVVYTSTGCFGSGSVRQGSTVRGKNAVEQTDFEIVLNGNQPRPLTPATAMKNGGVYTVAAAFEATTLSLPANATAEIWVRIGATAFNVLLPDSWVWVNGAASDMTGKTNTTFCIAVRNDGVRVLASMAYSYDTTPAQS